MTMKAQITAVIITKNEEARIADCLKALSWVNEIIIVDNGSTDKTMEIARQLGAGILEASQKDFAGVRELGLQQASGKWILYIDADETVSTKLREEIQKTIRRKADIVGYYLKRDTYFLGHHWPYQDKVARLFLKKALKGWYGRIHETPVFAGESAVLTHPLTHRTHRTLEEMLVKTNSWSDIEAELRLNAHHPPVVWWRLLRVMITGFTQSYIDQRGWRAGTVGLIESVYQAFSMFITYAKLWELQNRKK